MLVTSPVYLKMGVSPLDLKGDGDEMATPPFPLKGHDDGMGHSSILPYGKW